MRRYEVADNLCMIIKYAKDVRYSAENVATHDRQMMPARPVLCLGEMDKEVGRYDVVAIDEGQFYPDLVHYVERWVNQGLIVIVAALDGTFQRKPFGAVLDLVPLADHVVKLTAICAHCQRDAPFSKRIGTETEVEVLGGTEKYVAVCHACYFRSEAHA